jgi:hypothetical protein
MAKVKAKVLCFVANGLRQPGDTFDYEGPYNRHLEYVGGRQQTEVASDEEPPAPRLRPGRKPKAQISATE